MEEKLNWSPSVFEVQIDFSKEADLVFLDLALDIYIYICDVANCSAHLGHTISCPCKNALPGR